MKGLRRLLYVGHNLPYPPHEGALIRSYHTVRLLARQFDLTGLYFFRRSALPAEEDRARALEEMEGFGSAVGFPIPQEWSGGRFLWDHARSILSGSAYTRWVHESARVRTALKALLGSRSVDIVHVDSLDLMAYLPSFKGLPVVLAHHNVESALLRRRAESEEGLRGTYLRFQARLVEKAERFWCPRVALNIAVSQEDAETFRSIAPGARFLVIPNGVDVGAFTPTSAEPSGGIVFVGGHSWFPNADGMEYFVREILPIIREAEPQVEVRWIGKAPASVQEQFRASGVEMLGYVPDIRPEVSRARCVIVPLRVGGGTRLKILDAWALGKAVVSTSRGCEGLETKAGENILIADDPRSFAMHTLRVLREPGLRKRLEEGGRRTAEAHYDWEVLGERMLAKYLELLSRT